jgi:hypothetical protein
MSSKLVHLCPHLQLEPYNNCVRDARNEALQHSEYNVLGAYGLRGNRDSQREAEREAESEAEDETDTGEESDSEMQVEKAATRTLGKREEVEKKEAEKGAKKGAKNIIEKKAERGAETDSEVETQESSEDELEDEGEGEGEGEGESSDDELTATIAADVKTLQRVCRTNHRARLRKLVTRNLAMCTRITSVTEARAQTLVAALPFKSVTMAPEPDAAAPEITPNKDLLAKSTQNSRYEQEKEDPHRSIPLIETDNPRKLPSVGTYITLRDNVSMEDDAALRFLPYFGDNDKTVFDLSVYDSESEEGEVQVATLTPYTSQDSGVTMNTSRNHFIS